MVIGTLSTVAAFFATLGLYYVFNEQYFTLMIAAVAYSCWHENWKAGVMSTIVGSVGVVLLLPPTMNLVIDSSSDVMRMLVFIFTSSGVCFLSYLNERTNARLLAQQDIATRSEEWLKAAAVETKLWAWEYDADRKIISWHRLGVHHQLRGFMQFDSWMRRLHPSDREAVKSMLERTPENSKFHIEYRVQTHNGIYWWSSRGVVLKQHGPGTLKFIGISSDITDQKEQTRLEPSKAVLERPQFNMSSLIEIDSIIHEVINSSSMHAVYRSKLIDARVKVEQLMVSDMSSDAKP